MRLTSTELHRVEIPLRHAFVHARKSRERAELIVVAIHSDDGRTGYGEIAPRDYLTGETVDSVLQQQAPELARAVIGLDFADPWELVSWLRARLAEPIAARATHAGFELALLDLAAKTFRVSPAELLGRTPGEELPAGVVIGFEVPTARLKGHCRSLRLAGRRHVKLKVGHSEDRARLEILFENLGGSATLRIDANGAWSPEHAVVFLKAVGDGLHSVEEPVARGDLEGMKRVRDETGVRVMADESLCSLQDAERLVEAQAVDVLNLRIAKCGGMLACLELAEFAKRMGLGVHLGTLVGETGLLSAAAELIGRCVEGFACLEGKGQNRFLLVEDIVQPAPESIVVPYGLVYDLDEGGLSRYRLGEPTIICS